jgi:hypothetical protein
LERAAEDVVLANDQVLVSLDVDLGAGVLAEQHPVALLDVERMNFAFVVDLALADGDHLALLGLLLGGIRDDDPALGLLFFIDPLDEDAILQRTDFHGPAPPTFGARAPSNSTQGASGVRASRSQWGAPCVWQSRSTSAKRGRNVCTTPRPRKVSGPGFPDISGPVPAARARLSGSRRPQPGLPRRIRTR